MSMVDIDKRRRSYGRTTRPAIDISRQIWVSFAAEYPDKNIRDAILANLIQLQLTSKIIDPDLIR